MIRKMTYENEDFYDYLGPVFGSRQVEQITGDRFYDDAEKEWYVHFDDKKIADAFISIKKDVIKNVYAINEEGLIQILKEVIQVAAGGVVPIIYAPQFESSGFLIKERKGKRFISVKGGYHEPEDKGTYERITGRIE